MTKPISVFLIILFVVVLGGILIWQLWPEGGTLSPAPTATPSPTPALTPAEQWQLYNDERYSYEIKYPDDWGTTKCLETIIFAPQDIVDRLEEVNCAVGGGKGLTLTINYRTKEQYENIILPYRKTDENKIVNLETIIIDNIESKHYTTKYLKELKGTNIEAGDIVIDVLVPYPDGYLEVTLLDYQYLEIYNQMISTFRFIE